MMIGRKVWNLEPMEGGNPPSPSTRIICPVCKSDRVYFKECNFHKHFDQYRLDIHLKCGNCSYVMTFGVHVSEDEFNRLRALHYRDTGHILINEVGGWKD